MKDYTGSVLMNQSDLKILEHLRKNSRETLTRMSKEVGIPISSLFDRLKRLEGMGVIKKYTCLFELKTIGIYTRVVILIKIKNNMKNNLVHWLNENKQVNNLMRTNGEWDLVMEALFRDIGTLEEFMENLDEKFEGVKHSVHYVLEDIKREDYTPDLTGP